MKVAVDIGFGYTKAIAENGRNIVFPSIVSKRFKNGNLGIEYEEKYVINYKNETYAVGEAGLNSLVSSINFDENRFASEYAKILILTSLYYLCDESEDVELALGLPLSLFASWNDKVKNYFIGSQDTVVVKNNAKTFKIIKCEVFPQGIGVLFNSNLIKSEGTIGIVEVGFRTTDCVLIEKRSSIMPLIDFSFSIDEGISRVIMLLINSIEKKYGVMLDLTNLLNFYESNTIILKGKQIDITDIKKEAINSVAGSITQKIETKWIAKLTQIDKIYIAGGGATLLSEKIKNIGNVEIVQDPQLANAKGFLNMLYAE